MHEVKPYRRAHPHSKLLVFETVLYLAFVIFLLLLLGYATNAAAAAVLVAFLPSLLFGVALLVIIQTDFFQPAYNWFVLVITLVIFGLVYFLVQSPTIQGLDALTVLVMNAILMGVILLILHASYVHEPVVHEHELDAMKAHEAKKKEEAHVQPKPEQVVHERTVVHHVHHEPVEDVAAVVHSIEDKAKALNFVIGRVYSVYHGGTERLRNKIRIDKEWYQEFNAIDAKDSERRRAQAIVLLSKIKDRLDLLQKPERIVFGEEASKLRNIAHNAAGNDAVIEVLVRNDKDPVRQYYEGARKFCEEGIQKLTSGKSIDQFMPNDPKRPKDTVPK